MFRSSRPVTAEGFHDRARELARVSGFVERLRQGAPEWLAIVGPRKVGKTSLILEVARRSTDEVVFVVLDSLEAEALSLDTFRRFALRVTDAALARSSGRSLQAAAAEPARYRRVLRRATAELRLPEDLAWMLDELVDAEATTNRIRGWLDLPEQLAVAVGRPMLVAIDEFQELAKLADARQGFDPFPMMRSAWQRHEHVAYVVSGSARSMLTELVTSQRSPFFQHFALMDLGPFGADEAIELLMGNSPRGRRIDRTLAAEVVRVIGGHPFYLQVIGQALVDRDDPVDRDAWKAALQEVLFSATGRLSLYFEREHDRLVGRSTYLAATLSALSAGPRRLTDVATAIGAKSGATVGYLERLGDAVVRHEDGTYGLADPTFAMWLAWRRPGGTVIPMTLVGDEAERHAAAELAQLGFELVYQSRASRGAFDLLAIRGPWQVGLQVKRSAPPIAFKKREWQRMAQDAKRFGWSWLIASVASNGAVAFLDPAKARTARTVRLGDDAAIDNVLAWLEQRRG